MGLGTMGLGSLGLGTMGLGTVQLSAVGLDTVRLGITGEVVDVVYVVLGYYAVQCLHAYLRHVHLL